MTVPLRAGEPTSIALGTTWSPLILEIPLPRELERARAVSVSLTDAGDRRSLREQLPISPGVAGESPLISFRVPAGWLEPGSYTSEVSEPGGSPLARYELRVEPDEPR